MKQYHFKDVLFMRKEKALAVENAEKELIGYIKKTDIPECEKGHAFSFTTNDEITVMLGIKKRGIKDLLVAPYIVRSEGQDYKLKDRVGNSLLYFCVEGDIDGKSIKIEENWSGDVEVKVDGTHIATVKVNDLTLKTTIHIEEDIYESSILFAITILMYFMYKIYKNESGFIEELIFG